MLTSGSPIAAARRLSRRSAAVALVTALFFAGCASYQPYSAERLRQNDREEGPKSGLLTGNDGAFKVFGAVKKPPEGTEGEEPATAGGGLAPDPNPTYEPGSGSGAPPPEKGGKVLF